MVMVSVPGSVEAAPQSGARAATDSDSLKLPGFL